MRRDVVLLECGPWPIEVIRAIRAATGLGLKEAKDLSEAAPVIVASGWEEGAAAEFARRLEAAGARVSS